MNDSVTQVLRIKKLKGSGIIAIAARHNLRETQAEIGADRHIDPRNTSQNVVLLGAARAAEVAADATNLMRQANLKPLRKDAVYGLEIIFSLPRASGIAEKDFFTDASAWAETFFKIPILSAIIHNDEAAPHCHAILLPLSDGRMIGNALMGNRTRLLDIQADFFEKVGKPYGLTRQTPQKRFSCVARKRAAALVIDCLIKTPKNLNEPTFCDALLDALTVNPMPVMKWLGLDMSECNGKEPKQFRHEKAIAFQSKDNTIVFDAVISGQKDQTLCSVVFADSTSPDPKNFDEYQDKSIRQPTKSKPISSTGCSAAEYRSARGG